ncbi:MAG TPA: DinB family protein [Terriglobales bacterium]|nr:DinB family protein [Terriglobales bacterium]
MNIFTETERQDLLSCLHIGRDTFLKAVAGLSEEQCSVRSTPECWTIRECVEHVASVEKLMFRALEKAPVTGAYANPSRDQSIRHSMLDRKQKLMAPEISRPSARFSRTDEAIDFFKQNREQVIAFVERNQDDLRQRSLDHPLLGPIDGYQALLVLALHPQRHAEQIEEIKACSGFRRLVAAS